MTKKVYCGNCTYLKEIIHPTESFIVACQCKINFNSRDTYRDIETHYKNPRDINKNNDCKHYKRKWWLLWR